MKYALGVVLCSALLAQDVGIVGEWHGEAEAGRAKLRTLIKVSKAADGALAATFNSVDQGSGDIPVDAVTFLADTLRFELRRFNLSYEGKLDGARDEIAGKLSQGNVSFILNLKRGGLAAQAMPKGRALTSEEREYLIGHLQRTEKLVADATAALTPAQWSFKPDTDRWSIAECAEHIAIVEKMLFDFVTVKVMAIPASPARPERSADDARPLDEKIVVNSADRSKPVRTMAEMQPTGRFGNNATAEFRKHRAHTIEYVRTTQDDLRNHSTPDREIRYRDAYQYLLMLAGHAERHTKQIEEIKASPDYPR